MERKNGAVHLGGLLAFYGGEKLEILA